MNSGDLKSGLFRFGIVLFSIIMINKKINTLFTEIVNNLIAGNCFNSAADQAVSFFVGLLPRSPNKG